MKNYKLPLVYGLSALLMFSISCSEQGIAPNPATDTPHDHFTDQNVPVLMANDSDLTPNGPDSFYQEPWENNYSAFGHSVHPVDYTLDGPNPILDEIDKYSTFVSNIPLDITVSNASSSAWYGNYIYSFRNRSDKPIHLDCTVIIFRAPSGSALHHSYWNSISPFGHPQQDYVEVSIPGTEDSFYIARLVFHDVPKSQRLLYPGASFEYRLGCPLVPNTGYITIEDSKHTVRVIADLDGGKNEEIIERYGTNRYTN
ncbi:hypothetical protein [Fulvivirga imtechensis]|nr:hypothetical protein [Fulvivirga imtechensis]